MKTNTARFWLAVIFMPAVLPLLIILYLKLRGDFGTSLQDLWQFFYFTVYRNWPVILMLYAGHLFALVPLALLLQHMGKLRLGYFLPAAYLLGGIVNTIGLPLIDPSSYSFGNLSGIILITMLSGGTYAFFHACLFWYMAGLHHINLGEHYANQH